jgi:hypothetical protein
MPLRICEGVFGFTIRYGFGAGASGLPEIVHKINHKSLISILILRKTNDSNFTGPGTRGD